MTLRLQDTSVTIVGLGLMGSSLAAALTARHACRRVVGMARREETVAQALAMGIIHEGTCHLAKGVRDAGVVVLATPVRIIIELIGQIGPLLPPGCLLTDVGSTKQTISHLPYLLAVSLVATAEDLADDAIWEVAASGFRDTSRLAASDGTMMLDVLLTNRAAVRQVLARFQDQLAGLAHLLETGDGAGLCAAITAAAQKRRRLFP